MYPLNRQNNIIVIGGNAAGPAAAAKAKRTAPDASVLMIEAGDYISTGTCELPYLLSGEIKEHEEIVFFNPETFEKEKGVKVLTSHFVEKIDTSKRIILVKNRKSGHKFEQPYDKLILSTGSKAKNIQAIPDNLENVFTLKSVADLLLIKSYLEINNVKNILIIGSGYIGLETADALISKGYIITMLEKEKLPMPGIEDETRNLAADLLKKNNVEYYGGVENVKYNHDGRKFKSVRLDGRVLEYEMVLLSVGFEPNNDLAVSSKLEIGRYGGIKVDQKLRTSNPNIYAAGDCIEIVNLITGRPDYFPLATIAHQAGHIAGENAAGGNAQFQPVVKNIGIKLFGRTLTAVGLNSTEAKAHGYNISSYSAVVPNLVKVMPKSENVFGKILIDKNTKQILGANFLGGTESVGYGDLISSLIRIKAKASELARINFNYSPPISPFVNLLSVLGRKIEREFK